MCVRNNAVVHEITMRSGKLHTFGSDLKKTSDGSKQNALRVAEIEKQRKKVVKNSAAHIFVHDFEFLARQFSAFIS
jgi:hypothetical protein